MDGAFPTLGVQTWSRVTASNFTDVAPSIPPILSEAYRAICLMLSFSS